MKSRSAFVIFLVFASATVIGCKSSTFKKVATSTVVAPAGGTKNAELGARAAEEIEAGRKAEAARIAEQSKIIAGVRAAKFAAGHITEPADMLAQKAIVDELMLAEKSSTVIATAEDERAAMERVALNLAGRVEEANSRYKSAEQRAEEEKARTVKAEGERDEARRAVESAKEEARKEREEQARAYEARLAELKRIADAAQAHAIRADDEAERRQREKFMSYLSWGLLGAGFLCALGAVATMYVSKGTEWLRAAILGACGSGFGVCYWTVNQWWFKWAVIGTITLVVIAVILYVWTEAKTKRTLDEKQADLDDAQVIREAAKKFIRRLDGIKGKSLTATEWDAWLSSLRGDMERDERDVIHELRAEANISTTA